MADLNYKVKVDTKQAQDALGGLKQRVSGLGTAFKALAVGLVARELVTTIRQFQDLRQTLVTIEGDATKAANSFDLIKKFTAQTTFQLDEVTRAFITFKNAGLRPTTQFMENIGNIAAGMGKRIDDVAQAVFNATTGEFEMLKQLGIKVKTEGDKLVVNFRGVAKEINNNGRDIIQFLNDVGKVEFAGSIERQSQTLTGAISNLKDNFALFLNAIGEAGLTAALTDVARGLGNVAKEGGPLATIIGKTLGGAVKLLADNFKILLVAFTAWLAAAAIGKIQAIIGAFATLATVIIKVATGLRTAVAAMVAFNVAMGKNIAVKVAQGVLLLGGALATYFGLASDAIAGNNDELEKLEEQITKIKAEAEGDLFADMGALSNAIPKDIQDKIDKQSRSMENLTESYQIANRETLQLLDLNNRMIGQSEEQVLLNEYLSRATEKYKTEIQKLAIAKKEVEAMDEGPEKAAALEAIAKANDTLTESYREQTKALEEKAARDIENIQNQRLQVFGLEEISKANREVRAVQDEMAKMTMSEIEKKHYDIKAAARESAEAQLEEMARLKGVSRDMLDPDIVDEYYERAMAGVEDLKQVTQEHYELSRTWEVGWERAYKKYVEEATNAATQAERVFATATSGMEEMLMTFIETGELNWEKFLKSIVNQLIKAQLSKLIADVFGGIAGVFGGGSSSGGGGGGFMGGLLGGIGSAVGSAVGGLFGGFFANGGYLPAGKFGVAGEAGPELITGPANVTPMSGMGNVTYNIQAVDAQSFQALLARDPGALHAIAEQGRRTMMGAR